MMIKKFNNIYIDMPPAPLSFESLQPFKTIRDNWSTIRPYYDNYMTTISFTTILTAFLGTISLIVKHGFKFPRLHPDMDVEELQPRGRHPNQFISEDALLDVKLFEFERSQALEAWLEHEQWMKELREKAKPERGEDRDENSFDNIRENDLEKSNAKAAEEELDGPLKPGIKNDMDILDDNDSFDLKIQEKWNSTFS